MAGLIDLTNKRFGKWIVIHRYDNPNKEDERTLWTCRCDCGTIRNIESLTLRSGKSKSCGCSKDGHSKTRLYSIWCGIRDRTSCENRPRAKDYIGRGITMCEEWNDWNVFKSWAISNGYSDTLSIDRIDNNKGYCPQNCRWVDAKTQGENKRNNIVVEINGETHILAEWCRILGLNRCSVKSRILNQGLTPYEALTIPFVKGNRRKLKRL